MSRGLERVQRWMQAVVTHPDSVEEGLATDGAREAIEIDPGALETLVTRSDTLTAAQRLGIYRRGYYLRLLECLRDLLPTLRHALGPELFDRFAVDYLQHEPSRSYTLDRLDSRFVRYLREHRPDRDLPPEQREWWPDFMIDLATLEHGVREVFDGPGAEGEDLPDRRQVAGLEPLWLEKARLVPVPSLVLHTFRFPVLRYFEAVRAGDDPPYPPPADSFAALFRSDYAVRLRDLSRAQFAFLEALAAGTVVVAAAGTAGVSRLHDARDWLGDWAEAGLFRALELPDA